jgi:excisionase family DNA binding protein
MQRPGELPALVREAPMTTGNTRDQATREILSPEELADFLGCGRTFAYKLLAEKSIPSFKVGNKLRRVRLSDARDYVERCLADTN